MGARARSRLRRTDAPLSLLAALALTACSDSERQPDDDPVDASLVADAFVWGYPLVVSERTMQTFAGLIGVNALFNQDKPATASTQLIVSPNQDTLYSVAVLDLRSEPVVLTVPDVTDRYWTYQFLDAWTTSFHYLGTRATGGMGGTFVIAPPEWEGELPPDAELVRSPTAQMFLLGRYLFHDEADIANVAELTRTVAPLHEVTGAPPPADPPPFGKAPGKPTEVGTEGAAFFDELGDALQINAPASDADVSALARFAPLGIGPGLHPAAAANEATRSALEAGVDSGSARIEDALASTAQQVNGWTAYLDLDGDDPLLRAAIARAAWGANVPAEAVYAISIADSGGAPYTGTNAYVVRFEAGQLPPVDADSGFWSLTLYGPDRFFVDNPLDRYAIGDRTAGLVYGTDGSLEIHIQNEAPIGEESNWLPAPAGEFTLMLRLYLPSEQVLSGSYPYPAVVATN